MVQREKSKQKRNKTKIRTVKERDEKRRYVHENEE